MPLLAQCLALHFTTFSVAHQLQEAREKGTAEDNRELQAIISGLKAYTTWATNNSLQHCRECCGGIGYISVNKICELRKDHDVFVTFEGDNTVLLQQVAKDLLAQYSKQFSGGIFTGILSFITKQIHDVVTNIMEKNPLTIDSNNERRILSKDFQLNAFKYREARLLHTLSLRLLTKVKRSKKDQYIAWTECLDHLLTLSLSHIERIVLEYFYLGVENCPDLENQRILRMACQLFALNTIYNERGWYMEQGYIGPNKSRAIRTLVLSLSEKLRHNSLAICESFGIPDICLPPIAKEDIDTLFIKDDGN